MWLRLAPGEWVVNISGYVAITGKGGDYLQCIFFFFFFFRKVGGREGREKDCES